MICYPTFDLKKGSSYICPECDFNSILISLCCLIFNDWRENNWGNKCKENLKRWPRFLSKPELIFKNHGCHFKHSSPLRCRGRLKACELNAATFNISALAGTDLFFPSRHSQQEAGSGTHWLPLVWADVWTTDNTRYSILLQELQQ